MTVANIAAARDKINLAINTAWQSMAEPSGWPTPGVDWPPILFFQDMKNDRPEAQPFGEIDVQHQSGGAVAIGDVGTRRFRNKGVVTVTVHAIPGDGLTMQDHISNIIQAALEARQAPDTVYFRDVRVVDDGEKQGTSQVRIIANFDYDRVH